MSLLKEISITELSNLRIGHASDYNAQTGVTVLYFPLGAKVGCDNILSLLLMKCLSSVMEEKRIKEENCITA